jgi:hypothetical protein
MAKFKITTPDGVSYVIEAPENTPHDELTKVVQSRHNANQFAGGRDVQSLNGVEKFYGGMNASVRQMGSAVQDLLPRAASNFLDEKVWDGKRQELLEQAKAFKAEAGTTAKVGGWINEAMPNVITGIATGGVSLLPRALAQFAASYNTTPGSTGERATQGALAATGEAIPAAALKLVTGAVRGTDAARRLIDKGVYPTVGQAMGGIAKKAEDLAMSLPFVGDAINYGRNGALKEGVAAAQSLGGVPGINRNNAGFTGNQIINKYFDEKYKTVTKPLIADLDDPAFIQATGDALRRNNVTPSGRADVNLVLDNARIDGSGTITNGDVHNLIQALRQRSADLKVGTDPYARSTGRAFGDVRDALSANLENNIYGTPREALDAFNATNRSYAQTVPSMKASEGAVAARNDGLFTPVQYANAVTANAKSQGNRASVREGNAQAQSFANDMVDVLGKNYPDSGTSMRYLFGRGVLDAVAAPAAFVTGTALPLSIGTGVAGALNTPVGRKAIVGGYDWQKAWADALRGYVRPAGTAGAALLGPQGD